MSEPKTTPLGEVQGVGLNQVIRFRDARLSHCMLQKNVADPQRLYLGSTRDGLILLDEATARALVAVIETWVLTGNFTEDEAKQPERKDNAS